MLTVGENFLKAFFKLFELRFCVSNNHWKNTVKQRLYVLFERHYYIKIIVTLIPIDLLTNWLSFLFCSFVWSKNENHFSGSWWLSNKKSFCLWRVPLYFKSMLNSIDFYRGIFLQVIRKSTERRKWKSYVKSSVSDHLPLCP